MAEPPEPNYDEAAVGEVVLPPLTLDGRPVTDAAGREACRRSWLRSFAAELYGPIPPPPDSCEVTRLPLAGERAERLVLTLGCAGRRLEVDAALWLPEGRPGPVPLVVGLDSIGPAGIMLSDAFPLDPLAIVSVPKLYGLEGGRLAEQVRGVYRHRWPVEAILARGWGLLLGGYGSWTPDHPEGYRRHGVFPLMGLDGGAPVGALSLWAWALSRLTDVATALPEVDPARIALAGHSRLGKAALWCAANDTRSSDLLLSSSGCGGLSPSRRPFGETLAILTSLFPHWLICPPDTDPKAMSVDQHQLAACVAPRRLYSATASDDLWADPRGTYLAMQAAAPFWGIDRPTPELPPVETVWTPGGSAVAGPLGWHLRPGGHDMLPYDWRRFLAFLAAA